MKKILILTTSLLVVSSLVMAQKDKKATAILDEMSKKYQTMKSFSAAFTYGIEGTNAKLTESYKGDVTVKGAKFRLKMLGQEVFTNGKELYSYTKETNECQVSEFNPAEMDALSPDQIKSVEVLKGESAIKEYGAEAKDGVIKITTKKKVNL